MDSGDDFTHLYDVTPLLFISVRFFFSAMLSGVEQILQEDDDHVLMGDMVYNFLVSETNMASQQLSILPGYPPLAENIHAMDNLSHSSPATCGATSPTTTYAPLHFIRSQRPSDVHRRNNSVSALSPSPSPSQTSSTSEHNRLSPELSSTPEPFSTPEASPTPEPTCRQASPVFNSVRGKWSCRICEKCFRGRWECRRHIGVVGKRVKCLACGGKLTGREDSLRRHFKKYCKGDVRNLKFEDAFSEVKEEGSPS